MSTANVVKLSTECDKLMASYRSAISMFTAGFIEKLKNKPYPFLFKMYLLPFMTWFDHSILKELLESCENIEAVELVKEFDSSIDYNLLLTSYTVPEFSQLIIPYKGNESEFTVLLTKYFKNHNEIILQDLINIKNVLTCEWEITNHAIHLVAMHSKSSFFYWLIPRTLQPLIEDRLTQNQHSLWNKGIMIVLPDWCSSDNNDQSIQGSQFSFWNINTHDTAQVGVIPNKLL